MSHQRSVWPSSCKAKRLLLRDIRPSPNSQTQFLLRKNDLCLTRCIYCDIWKLALLISSRQNRNQSRTIPTSPFTAHGYPCELTTDQEKDLKSIESGHHLQRARLSSIISICTVDGAEESEGLRIAHDRCLGTVFELMRQERAVQRQMSLKKEITEREAMDRDLEIREWRERQQEMDCAHRYRPAQAADLHRNESRRASEVSCAM